MRYRWGASALIGVAAVVVALEGCSSAALHAGVTKVPTASSLKTESTAPVVPAPSRSPAVLPSETSASHETAVGCSPTTATTPEGASAAPIQDVDGDGKRDTEWAVQKRGGTLQFGITTASGATVSAEQGFAGGGGRSFVVGTLANGVVVAITSEGRDSPVYTFSGCAFHPLEGKSLLPSTSDKPQFILYSDSAGGAGGCFGGRLGLIERTTSSALVARLANVSVNGRDAVLTNKTEPVPSNTTGVSCNRSPVLRPIYHPGS